MTKKIKRIRHDYRIRGLILIGVFAVIGAAFIIFSKAATGTDSFSLSPTTGDYNVSTNFTVTVYANATDNVNTVGPQINFDTTKLSFVSLDITGSAFPNCINNGATGGTVQFSCGLLGSTATGNNLKVGTITFKTLVSTGTTSLSFGSGSLIYTGNAVNVWNGVTTGGTYTLDSTVPSASITAPTNGATVTGTSVAVTANASDDSGTVSKVEFYINGVLVATDTSLPYSYTWNTTTIADGTYPVMIKAYDAATPTANVGTSTVSVKVQNSKPNLVVSSITLSPAQPNPGDTVTISAVITNSGSLALAAGSSVSTGFSVDSTALTAPIDTTALAIGASRTATTTWTATLGSHTITATADKTNVIVESNESDNTLTKTLTVQKAGDANNDGQVNLADFSILSNNWGVANATIAQGDFNGDGQVNLADFSILSNNWGK